MISQKTLRRPAVLAIALLTLLALTATAFAAGGYVVYRISAGENELPEGSVNEWIDFEADDVLPYDNYTEENGEVTVIFDPEDWEK